MHVQLQLDGGILRSVRGVQQRRNRKYSRGGRCVEFDSTRSFVISTLPIDQPTDDFSTRKPQLCLFVQRVVCGDHELVLDDPKRSIFQSLHRYPQKTGLSRVWNPGRNLPKGLRRRYSLYDRRLQYANGRLLSFVEQHLLERKFLERVRLRSTLPLGGFESRYCVF